MLNVMYMIMIVIINDVTVLVRQSVMALCVDHDGQTPAADAGNQPAALSQRRGPRGKRGRSSVHVSADCEAYTLIGVKGIGP